MYTHEIQKGGITYAPFHPARHPELLPKVVECYRQVFAEEPWNEWKKCPVCDHRWGISSTAELEAAGYIHCGVPVVDYWPEEKVSHDITLEITDESSCWIALTEEHGVIGFTWGYPISPTDLAIELDREDVADQIKTRFGSHELVAYQDEIAVVEGFRNQKVATTLGALRLRDMKLKGLKVGVVRTKRNPPTVTYLWYIRTGYQVISEYGGPDQKVVMARSYDGYELITDKVPLPTTSSL